ncbi:hypothetical protein ACIQBJ_15500 [Kitasatospora sp. NPDC088391]|uniref:hypothetical protein n=1 Tax=Kitasatospora sp. NPDC088391 TaxID=3364074 RepID=UPI0038115266
MAERGGRAAADGFQYQYLVTLEALLDAADDGGSEVAAALIETVPGGSGIPSDGTAADGTAADGTDTVDPDAVDFFLVRESGSPVLAAQVKSGGPGVVMSGPAAFAVLLRMVRAHPDADAYRLVTNLRLHPKAALLNQVLSRTEPERLGSDLERSVLDRSPLRSTVAGLTPEELRGLGRARVQADSRDRYRLHEELRERIRAVRSRHRHGSGLRSADRMSNHLVREIFRRAGGEGGGVFTLADFRAEVLTPGQLLAEDSGVFDWGLMVGRVPAPPDLPRPDVLERIAAALGAEAAGRTVSSCALLGLSGMGKTSLAAAFAHDRADSYDRIFWVDAESEAALLGAFQQVRTSLTADRRPAPDGGSGLRQEVHALLATTAERWLMVFDNARDRRQLHPWLPAAGRGHLVITSTDQAGWATHPGRIEVDRLSVEEAAELVRMRLTTGPDARAPLTGEERRNADRLAAVLERWPLALELACGYLAGCERGLAEVPRYLERIRALALDHADSVPSGYPDTLVGAIRLALGRLARTAPGRHPDVAATALSSMAAAAYFAAPRIPVQLLLATVLVPREEVLRTGQQAPLVLVDSPENDFNADDVHRALRSESLVKRDDPLCTEPPQEWSPAHTEGIDETVGVNEIVQHVVRTLLEAGKPDGAGRTQARFHLERAALHTQGWLSAFAEQADETHLLAVLPHAQSVADHARRLGIASDELALLWGNLGGVLSGLGEFGAARTCFEAELDHLLQREVPVPLLELKTRGALADLAHLQQAPDAEVLAQLGRVRDLARSLKASCPNDVVNTVANALTTLRRVIGRQCPGPEAAGLLDDLRSLCDELPETPQSRIGAELRRLTTSLTTEALSARQIEERCRALLADPRLPLLQRTDANGLLAESLAHQDRWAEAASVLRPLVDGARDSPLNPQGLVSTAHNLGLRAGLCAMLRDPEAYRLLVLAIELLDLAKEEHLRTQPGMSVKLGLLRLAAATAAPARDPELIRRARAGVPTGSAELSAPHEIGWRHLYEVALLTSRTIAPD